MHGEHQLSNIIFINFINFICVICVISVIDIFLIAYLILIILPLQEDVLAAEMVSSYLSLSLYWCRGLSSLKRKLMKKTNKIQQLENVILEMKKIT